MRLVPYQSLEAGDQGIPSLLSVWFISHVIAHCKTVFLGFLLSPVARVTIWSLQRSKQGVMEEVKQSPNSDSLTCS